jgi:hypothetical protein
MNIKFVLSAVALALLPCLPAKAEFEFASFTADGKGMVEIESDSVTRYGDGTVKFLSRRRYFSTIVGAEVVMVDCIYPRIMFISHYNTKSKSWINDPDPQWQSTLRSPVSYTVAMKACSY